MATRWEVTKAVRASRTLPAPSRLIMLTLADVAEVGTAEIPARWTPSLTVLAAETSLDRRTVQRHLDALEDAKWLIRSRPPQSAQWYGERVRYALRVPPGVEVAVSDHQGGGTEPPPGWQETAGGGGTESHGGRHTTAPNQINRSQSDPSSSSTASTTKDSTKTRTKTPKTEPPRADVDKICNLLADRIAENDNDGVRPEITNEWRRSARLLLDKDKRTVDRVVAAIEWCQSHEFWHTNILSMPTLRKQYKQLQLKAKAEQKRGTSRVSTDRPASNAPERIPATEKCEHSRRETTCGLCRAERIGRTP